MKKVILLSLSILLISLAYSFAEVPCKINYQGRLIKDNVPVDGTKTMKFSIYDSAVGPTLLWTSGNVSVEVHNGLFRYVLDLSSIDDWTAGETLYLEVKVETDILTPREELYAYPYAINSHLLEGATKEYFLNTSGDSQTKQGDLNIMGNVGIGTTEPGAKLEVNGRIKDQTGFIMPIGSIMPYAGSSGPPGWLLCDGRTLTEGNAGEVYNDLYNVIGTIYGGTGPSDFKVPDLRGRFALGKDDMGGSSANRVTNPNADSLAGAAGEETHTLTIAEMPAHRHKMRCYKDGSSNQSPITYGVSGTDNTYLGIEYVRDFQSVGGYQPHNNMPPYLTLNYIIKY